MFVGFSVVQFSVLIMHYHCNCINVYVCIEINQVLKHHFADERPNKTVCLCDIILSDDLDRANEIERNDNHIFVVVFLFFNYLFI